MPAQEVGEAFVAIRAIATGFREQASQEVNQALASVRERATVPIRAQMETTSANRIQQSFQPVIAGAQRMGTETEGAYRRTEGASHHAYETIRASHDGIRARFGETLRAASLMGGGVALAYGAFSQGREAIAATNELAHATMQLRAATGLDAQQASAWVAIARARGVEATSLQTSFNALARVTSTANDAFRTSTGTLTAAGAAFHNLGITQQQLQAVQGNMPAQLNLIADGFERMGPGVDRTRIAQELFGRSYSQVLPILADGSKGLQDNIDKATEYGATLSGKTLEDMHRLRTEQQQLSLEMLGMRVRIATALEPALLSLAGTALHVGHVFLNVVTAGIHTARDALHEFLGTRIGQGLQTIVGDAGRFAGMIRDRFVHDLTRPMSFGRLFDNFERDLTTWLPRAARDFWTQLNSDLFAPGKDIVLHPRVEISPHTGVSSHRLVGAGIFPGMDWSSLGREFGGKVVEGMLDALGEIRTHGQQIISAMEVLFGDIVNWVVNGGGAAKILSGGLAIADALVSTIFDPAFWIANWRPILGLAFTFFSDGLGDVGRNAGRKMLGEIVTHLRDTRWVGPVIRFFEQLPTRIGDLFVHGLVRLDRFLQDHTSGLVSDLARLVVRGIGHIPGLLGRLAQGMVNGFNETLGRIRQSIENILGGGFLLRAFTRMIQFAARLIVLDEIANRFLELGHAIADRIVRGFDYVKGVVERALGPTGIAIVQGIWHGIERGWDWLMGEVEHLFHSFISDVEQLLGIASPSRVAMDWGLQIVLGLVRGLASLPARLFRLWEEGVRVEIRIAGRLIGEARSIGSRILHAVVNEVERLPGQIWGLLQDIAAAEHRGAAIVGAAAERLGLALLHGVIHQVQLIPGRVVTLIEHIGRGIRRLGGWLLREGEHIGSEILHGIWHALSNPDLISGPLKSAFHSALSDVGGWLGISSPSRVARDRIGKPVNDGIIRGLDPLRDDLHDAIIPVTNHILNIGHDQGQSGGRTMGTGITTGIRSGLNPLQSMLTHSIVTASNGALAAAKRALGIHSPSSVYAEQIGRPLADGIVHGMGGLEKALSDRIIKAAQAAQAAAGSFGPGVTPGGTAATGANQALGLHMMLAAGWPQSQWGALQALWNRESGWNQYATNPSSGAYGIPQSLPADKMASAGADWRTNAATQIRWGLDYIRGRYGSPGGAWAHETQYGWYHQGGVVPGSPTQNVPIIARGGEVVFTPEQMKALSGRSVNIGRIEINNPATGADAARELLNELAQRVG